MLESAFGLVFIVYVVLTYNRFVRLKEDASSGKMNIDVELDRRAKMLEGLSASAKRHLAHEAEVFTQVARLRSQAQSAKAAGDVAAQAACETSITKLMPTLTATVEAYPELQGDEVVMRLMESLENTENRLGFAKSFYNGAAQAFNEARKSFPAVLVANLFANFRVDQPYWGVNDETRAVLEAKNLSL